MPHTDGGEGVWYDEGKGGEEYQEDEVDGQVGVEDHAAVRVPLLVEQAGDQRVGQQVSTRTLNLNKIENV